MKKQNENVDDEVRNKKNYKKRIPALTNNESMGAKANRGVPFFSCRLEN